MNKPYTVFVLCFVAVVATLFSSCKEPTPSPPDTQTVGTPLDLKVPDYFPNILIPDNNPTTLEGVALGRRLYYDPLLSSGGPLQGMACASCHLQDKSFSNNASGVSVIPHVNMAWRNNFLWKGGIGDNLEEAMRFEVEDFFQSNLNNLQQDAEYPDLFKAAFGSDQVSLDHASKALAQFFRTLTSSNSKFDKYLRREIALSYSERQGLTIFESEKGDCFHCHALPLSRDNGFHNIGLDSVFNADNSGRFLVSGDSNDLGAFSTPSLRNIALTGPYMHDGRFATLREVIEHYNSGVKHTDYLDPIMTKNGGVGLNLSNSEIDHLIDFLNTLTDTTFLNNKSLASPF